MIKRPYIVGVTGGSGSGKTHFLQNLLSHFNKEDICLLSQDNYYHSLDKQLIDENGVENFDTPTSIDYIQFANDIQSISSGKSIFKEEYTFNNINTQAKLLEFAPAPILVVEGIFVFYHPEIARQIDLKIFIDAKEHLKLKRRIIRDQQERGYDPLDVLYRYEYHVSPTFEKFIEPLKGDADLIIPNNTSFNTALEVLIAFLKSKIL